MGHLGGGGGRLGLRVWAEVGGERGRSGVGWRDLMPLPSSDPKSPTISWRGSTANFPQTMAFGLMGLKGRLNLER